MAKTFPGVWPKRLQVCRLKRPQTKRPDADQGFFQHYGMWVTACTLPFWPRASSQSQVIQITEICRFLHV